MDPRTALYTVQVGPRPRFPGDSACKGTKAVSKKASAGDGDDADDEHGV